MITACARPAPIRPPRRRSRLARRPGLDGDHALLRLPEVVSVRVRKTGPVHQHRAADLVAVSSLWPRRLQVFLGRLRMDLRVPAARRLLGQAAGVLGALGSTGTFIATVTIIPFMPDGWDIAAGGFPAMTGYVPFLMKMSFCSPAIAISEMRFRSGSDHGECRSGSFRIRAVGSSLSWVLDQLDWLAQSKGSRKYAS
jgi:hypothetical protein